MSVAGGVVPLVAGLSRTSRDGSTEDLRKNKEEQTVSLIYQYFKRLKSTNVNLQKVIFIYNYIFTTLKIV